MDPADDDVVNTGADGSEDSHSADAAVDPFDDDFEDDDFDDTDSVPGPFPALHGGGDPEERIAELRSIMGFLTGPLHYLGNVDDPAFHRFAPATRWNGDRVIFVAQDTDDDGSDVDMDETAVERYNRRQLQRAIDASLRPEFDPVHGDPADAAQVAAAPIKTLEAAAGSDCVICMEAMAAGDEYMDFSCAHVMHAECSRTWFATARTCPTCKCELFAPA